MTAPAADPLLTRGEVARLFRVANHTVTRWANEGKLSVVRTLGGHRRYRQAEVYALLAQHHRDTGRVSIRLAAVVLLALAAPASGFFLPNALAVLLAVVLGLVALTVVIGVYGTADLERTRALYAEDFATLNPEPIERAPGGGR